MRRWIAGLIVFLATPPCPADPIRALKDLNAQWSTLSSEGMRYRQSVSRSTLVYIRFTTVDRSPGAPAETVPFDSPRIAGGTVVAAVGKDRFIIEHDLPDVSLPVWLAREGQVFGGALAPARSRDPFSYTTDATFNPSSFEGMQLQFRCFVPTLFWTSELQPILDAQTRSATRPSGRERLEISESSPNSRIVDVVVTTDSPRGREVRTTRVRFERGTGGIEWLPTRKERFTDWLPSGAGAQPVRTTNENATMRWEVVSSAGKSVVLPVEYESSRHLNLMQDRTRSKPGYVYSWSIETPSLRLGKERSEDARLARLDPNVAVAPANRSSDNTSERFNWWLIAFAAMSAVLVVLLIIRARTRTVT